MPNAPDSAPGSAQPPHLHDAPSAESFIARWQGADGGERANYGLFLTELCDLIGVPQPNPSQADNAQNDYVFERRVEFMDGDGVVRHGFIDLYKRGSFVCETKQGVEKRDEEFLSEQMKAHRAARRTGHGVRGSSGWSESLLKARNQAEQYCHRLPASEGRPPLLLVIDVGYCIEVYSEFSRTGGTYVPFPEPRTHRILLAQLADPAVRQRLRKVWQEPMSLDPSQHSARVTCEIADKLGRLAKKLEEAKHPPQAVAEFLMRCLFTMFAEDVNLIPLRSFQTFLESQRGNLVAFPNALQMLWRIMDTGGYFPGQGFMSVPSLKRFNGGLFRNATTLPLNEDQLELLIEAAASDWRDVEPAIFGTLLERALDSFKETDNVLGQSRIILMRSLVFKEVEAFLSIRPDDDKIILAASLLRVASPQISFVHLRGQDKSAKASSKERAGKECAAATGLAGADTA
ncbi:MAG: type IIL restriction-modification enzyme MmeI [Opitutales bacterium]